MDGAIREGNLESGEQLDDGKCLPKRTNLGIRRIGSGISQGREFTPKDFLDYLEEKYSRIYEL